jgi:hypothetical protein
MIKFIKEKLFGKTKLIEELQFQLKECSDKLVEKQEHINKTNAYWKKKMREVKVSK